MKILHYVDENRLSWSLPWLELISEIAKQHQGDEHVVLCRPGGTLQNQAESSGFRVVTYQPPAACWPPICRGFAALLDRIRPDLVHTRLSSAAAIGGFWGRKKGIPVASTIDKYPKGKYYELSSFIVPSSGDVARHMKEMGFADERMKVIRNAISVSNYAPDPESRKRCRQNQQVGEDTMVFLAMGRFVPWKGFDLLIEAAKDLKTENPFELWIVGEGPMKETLERKASEHGGNSCSTGSVRFFPFTDDVRPFLWAADVFVQPSYHVPGSGGPETFSLALLEAMAAGLPSVAFACGGAPDIVVENVSGWLAEPGSAVSLRSAIEKALNELPSTRFKENAMAAAREHDVTIAAGKYHEVYDALLSGRQKNASGIV